MRPPIDGSVTLVTGASSGIGEAFARLLAPRVKSLALVARRQERLETLRKELTAAHPRLTVETFGCDISDRAAVDVMLEAVKQRLGPVDVLVNNAGMGDMGLFDLADWEKTERMIQLNVIALSYLTHRLLEGMLARKRGGILNISSGFGLTTMPGVAVYAGTKHYVSAFTECLGQEARSQGVVVSQVCPGPVKTEFLDVAYGGKSILPGTSVLEISAEACARLALAGFERGRAIIIPGLRAKMLVWASRVTPRFVQRLVFAPVTAQIRRQQTLPRQDEGARQIREGSGS